MSMLEDALKIGPAYLTDLLGLVQQPKRFVAGRVAGEPLPVRDALLFLGISFALSWIIKMSFLRSAPWLEVLPDAAFVVLEILAYGGAICLAWRVVRGRADLQKFFVIHFYYSGVVLILIGVWFMLLMGIMRAADPMLYAEMWEAVYGGTMLTFVQERAEDVSRSPMAIPMALAILLGVFVTAGWMFAGWGAYRELNGLSRWRSAAAAIVFIVLWFPISAVLFFVANAAAK